MLLLACPPVPCSVCAQQPWVEAGPGPHCDGAPGARLAAGGVFLRGKLSEAELTVPWEQEHLVSGWYGPPFSGDIHDVLP